MLEPSAHPILAIDYGKARIGLAATDLLGIAVHPVATVNAREAPLEEIAKVISSRQISTIVLGLPLHMNGSEGKSAEAVRAFGSKLSSTHPEVAIFYVDERLTTVSASERLAAAGVKARNQKALIDQAAAMEILQTFLDEQGLSD